MMIAFVVFVCVFPPERMEVEIKQWESIQQQLQKESTNDDRKKGPALTVEDQSFLESTCVGLLPRSIQNLHETVSVKVRVCVCVCVVK